MNVLLSGSFVPVREDASDVHRDGCHESVWRGQNVCGSSPSLARHGDIAASNLNRAAAGSSPLGRIVTIPLLLLHPKAEREQREHLHEADECVDGEPRERAWLGKADVAG